MDNKFFEKKSTAVIIAPYYEWVKDFWPDTLMQDTGGPASSLQLLDWTLAALSDSSISKKIIICHPVQTNFLSHLKNVTLVESSNPNIIQASIDIFRNIHTDLIYIYPWVVFRKEFYSNLRANSDSDIVLSAKSSWQESPQLDYKELVRTEKLHVDQNKVYFFGRFLDSEHWDAAFSGMAYLNVKALNAVVAVWDCINNSGTSYFHDAIDIRSVRFSDLVQELIDTNFNVSVLEVNSEVRTIKKPDQLSKFVFGTKGQTLDRLSSVLEESSISDLLIFSVLDWQKDDNEVLNSIRSTFKNSNVVVRSSSVAEDSWDQSLAGAFYSVLDVDISLTGVLEKAIKDVIDSYKKLIDVNDINFGSNQVLVQKFESNTDCSGVIFTRDLHTGTPYYVVNYDSISGRTDSVTSGDTNNLKTLVVYRESEYTNVDERFKKLLIACREVESKVNCDSLDIEFAISKDGSIHIFQVRPMTVANTWSGLDHTKFDSVLSNISSHINELNRTRGKTILSNMTDWNPAEMISTSPSPLALSLYEYLITDSTWRISRGECGYFSHPSESLMVSLGGKPYINVRNSFSSFVPKSIPSELREGLVDSWIDQLAKNPDQHDKVEFNIVPTCYTFDLQTQFKRLLDSGIEEKDIALLKRELLTLTDSHIQQHTFNLNIELEKVTQLASRVDNYQMREPNIHTIKCLLEDCRVYGILPFSNLARMAFIATAILKSLVANGILNSEDESNIKGNIHTITSEIINDCQKLSENQMSMSDFLKVYGHLRPGTYDINSKRYDEDPETYLQKGNYSHPKKRIVSGLDQLKLEKIDEIMKEHGFTANADQLMVFISDAIRGREDAKFGFTKALSLVLKMVESIGSKNNISRSDMAFVNIHSLLRWDSDILIENFEDWINLEILQRKDVGVYERALNLPDIVTQFTDIHVYHQLQSKPNFVTKNKVIADMVCLDKNDDQNIKDKIVLITSSDPGFDWIFTHKIAGLVTMYGGANSHMAIRCAEFDIPAAIGCGGSIYNSLVNSKVIEIDCVGEVIRPCLAH